MGIHTIKLCDIPTSLTWWIYKLHASKQTQTINAHVLYDADIKTVVIGRNWYVPFWMCFICYFGTVQYKRTQHWLGFYNFHCFSLVLQVALISWLGFILACGIIKLSFRVKAGLSLTNIYAKLLLLFIQPKLALILAPITIT